MGITPTEEIYTTIAFYLIGNAFSDAADPKNHLQ